MVSIKKESISKMKIVMTPAKRMKKEVDVFETENTPVLIELTQKILKHLQTLRQDEIKRLLKCSDVIAEEAYQNYQQMNLFADTVPALFSYQGIEYDHLAADLFTYDEYDYIKESLVILSGFYGILKPFDGVVPYRLELNNSLSIGQYKSLYQFWNKQIYEQLIKDDHCILDLGAKQYSIMIQKYLTDDIDYVKCYFKEKINHEFKEIGVYVKIARGEMIRYLIQKKATTFEEVKSFCLLGYYYDEHLSDKKHFVFVRENK